MKYLTHFFKKLDSTPIKVTDGIIGGLINETNAFIR
jgi:hypothetical protein